MCVRDANLILLYTLALVLLFQDANGQLSTVHVEVEFDVHVRVKEGWNESDGC